MHAFIISIVCWLPLFYLALETARLGSIPQHVRAFQVAYVVGYAGYFALVWFALRRSGRGGRSGVGLASWLIPCVLLRVIPLAVTPTDDAHRYLWEGRVQLAGHNPFALAPEDARLVGLRDADWGRINHRDYTAIYPPLAQLEFLVVAAIHPSMYTIKVFHVFWDCVTLVLVAMLLDGAGYAPRRAVVYGACPLVLTAFSMEGHVDSLMVCLVVLAFVLDQRGRRVASGVALGASIAAKLFPVVFLPWFFFRSRRSFGAAVGVVVLLYLPYLGAGHGLFESVGRFSSADSFFSFPDTMLGLNFAVGGMRYAVAVGMALALSVLAWRGLGPSGRSASGMAWVGALVRFWGPRGPKAKAQGELSEPRPEARAALGGHGVCAFGGYGLAASSLLILAMPVVHYWYLALPLVFLPFCWHPAWAVAGLLSVAYFEAQRNLAVGGVWAMPLWAPQLVWWGFLITSLGWGLLRWFDARRDRGG